MTDSYGEQLYIGAQHYMRSTRKKLTEISANKPDFVTQKLRTITDYADLSLVRY